MLASFNYIFLGENYEAVPLQGLSFFVSKNLTQLKTNIKHVLTISNLVNRTIQD